MRVFDKLAHMDDREMSSSLRWILAVFIHEAKQTRFEYNKSQELSLMRNSEARYVIFVMA